MAQPEYDSVRVDDLLQDAPAHVIGLVDLIKRTGAYSLQMREVSEPEPTVWAVVVIHYIDEDGRPTHNTEAEYHVEAAAAWNLGTALKRMVEQLMDGGLCTNCERPTTFYDALDGDPGFLEAISCVTYWNGETYTRTCKETKDDVAH